MEAIGLARAIVGKGRVESRIKRAPFVSILKPPVKSPGSEIYFDVQSVNRAERKS
jgi:hypothetical protein